MLTTGELVFIVYKCLLQYPYKSLVDLKIFKLKCWGNKSKLVTSTSRVAWWFQDGNKTNTLGEKLLKQLISCLLKLSGYLGELFLFPPWYLHLENIRSQAGTSLHPLLSGFLTSQLCFQLWNTFSCKNHLHYWNFYSKNNWPRV